MSTDDALSIEDATERKHSGDVTYAPTILLDCRECDGYTGFSQDSATQAECQVCEVVQSNERIVDIREKRL